MKQSLPVLLLTGYLGSGKTTLVNRILSNKRGIKFAVIVNDIGEVNIDASLIQQGGIVGHLGVVSVSAVSIANTVLNIIAVGLYGTRDASAVVIGKTVGSGVVTAINE